MFQIIFISNEKEPCEIDSVTHQDYTTLKERKTVVQMPSLDENEIKEAADKYGFNLEFKTGSCFKEKGYSTNLNELLSGVEIDVIAVNDDEHLLIECKGACQGTALILIKAPKNIEDKVKGTSEKSRWILNDDYKMPILTLPREAIYTSTGDFFLANRNKSLVKASKNNANNNFYKAQQQVKEAMVEYLKIPPHRVEDDTNSHAIVPLIVTNAEIWVVDYSLEEPTVIRHNYVFHVAHVNNELTLSHVSGEVCQAFSIPVVNINSLPKFIDNNLNGRLH